MSRKLIQKTETLLIVSEYGAKTVIDESSEFGVEFTEDDIFPMLDLNTVRILRMDMSQLVAEDITEDVARAWIVDLEAFGYDIIDFDEAKIPAFVKASRALDAWQDDIEAEAPVSNVYSTLDARTQGLRVVGASL